MNYIKELNAFREFLLFNELPAGAISLWYTLMGVNNAARWKKRFNAPNAVVGQLAGLSKQGLLDARNMLIEYDLITCIQGRKGRAPAYEIHSLAEAAEPLADLSMQADNKPADVYTDQAVDPSLDSSLDLSLDPSADQHLNIRKHKEKQKRRQEKTTQAHVLEIYENNIGKLPPMMQAEFSSWVDQVGEDVMTEAIRQVAKHSGKTFGYLEKVLEEWKAAQVKTPDDVAAYRKQRTDQTIIFTEKKSRKKAKSAKSVFDKLREADQTGTSMPAPSGVSR